MTTVASMSGWVVLRLVIIKIGINRLSLSVLLNLFNTIHSYMLVDSLKVEYKNNLAGSSSSLTFDWILSTAGSKPPH